MSKGDYEIILSNQAIKQIKNLSRKIRIKVKEILEVLQEYPIPIKLYDVKKIKGER